MAHDEDLADQIRELVEGEDHVVEQRMFGGLAFLVNGNMAVAASGEGGLLVRVDPEAAEAWIDDDAVTPMDAQSQSAKGRNQTGSSSPSSSQRLTIVSGTSRAARRKWSTPTWGWLVS